MLPERLMMRVAPTENDLFLLLVGRIESAELQRAGASRPLLVETIGLTEWRAGYLVSRLQEALVRYRTARAAFRCEQCMALRARLVEKAELVRFLLELEEYTEAAVSRLVTELLADFSNEERAHLWTWVLSHDPASVSKRRINVAALNEDTLIDAPEILKRVCSGLPKVASHVIGLDVTDS